MIKHLFKIILLLLPSLLYAQDGFWQKLNNNSSNIQTTQTLLKYFGDSTYSLGSNTLPSPREGAAYWHASNDIYMFGGLGIDENLEHGLFQDLWRFNGNTKSWTLLQGSRNVGLSTPNAPFSRLQPLTWIDTNGNLWLYGGHNINGQETYNDLWKYDSMAGTWSQVNTGLMVNDPVNFTTPSPGSRTGASTWLGYNGDLYLFGGKSVSDTTSTELYYNDIWHYNISQGVWAYDNGNQEAMSVLNLTNLGNNDRPTPRSQTATWTNALKTKVYIYGGYGFHSKSNTPGVLGDMWTYDIANGAWQNILENEIGADVALTGEDLVNPGFRVGACTWKDGDDNLWLFSGHNQINNNVKFNDQIIWKFDLSTSLWRSYVFKLNPKIISNAVAVRTTANEVYVLNGIRLYFNETTPFPSNQIWKLKFK